MNTKQISYRVVPTGKPHLILGHVFNKGDGWIFNPMCQMRISRRTWDTPQAALKGRVKNYELLEVAQ